MIRLAIALVGLAIFGAIFASIYYDPDNRVQVERASVQGDAVHQPRSQARVAPQRRAPASQLPAR